MQGLKLKSQSNQASTSLQNFTPGSNHSLSNGGPNKQSQMVRQTALKKLDFCQVFGPRCIKRSLDRITIETGA